MLSTLVLLPSGEPPAPGALVRTLTALVPAIVDGLVRDATVIAGGPDEAVRRIAEHAGCRLVENARFSAALREAAAEVRGAAVLVLRAGAYLDRSLLEEIARALGPEAPPGPLRPLLIRATPEGFAARLVPRLAPVAGVILPRQALDASFGSFAVLARSQRGARALHGRAAMAR